MAYNNLQQIMRGLVCPAALNSFCESVQIPTATSTTTARCCCNDLTSRRGHRTAKCTYPCLPLEGNKFHNASLLRIEKGGIKNQRMLLLLLNFQISSSSNISHVVKTRRKTSKEGKKYDKFYERGFQGYLCQNWGHHSRPNPVTPNPIGCLQAPNRKCQIKQ